MTRIMNIRITKNKSDFVETIRKQFITISWENLSAQLTSSNDSTLNGKLMCWKDYSNGGIILDKITGIAKPGSLLAIMGPNGSGKTTLLNVLNFRNRNHLIVTGQIKVNEQYVQSAAAMSSIAGYVEQTDLFKEYLTVKEHLIFHASLRLKDSLSEQDRLKRVDECLELMHLKKFENSLIGLNVKIGLTDGELNGLTVGQRRRLSLATELLTNPNLIFIDEPITNLDSHVARKMMDSLKHLSNEGKTVICTLKRPSLEVFSKVDKLCLLAEGRMAYFGDLSEANSFFTLQGYTMQSSNQNPADYFVEIVSSKQKSKEEPSKSIAYKLCDSFEFSTHYAKLRKDLVEGYERSLNPDNFIILSNRKYYSSNVFQQIRWLLWRSYMNINRHSKSVWICLFLTLIASLFLGLLYLRQKYNQVGVQNINGLICLLIIYSIISSAFIATRSYSDEVKLVIRENSSGVYSVLAYYISKFIRDLPRFTLLPILFIVIVYWMTNLNVKADRFFTCMAILILTSHVSASYASFVASFSSSCQMALTIGALTLSPILVVSGLFINNCSVPVYFYWLKFISWFYYAYELLMLNQWKDVRVIYCTQKGTVYRYGNGTDVLNQLKMKEVNVSLNISLLVAFWILWRLLALLALYIRTRMHQTKISK